MNFSFSFFAKDVHSARRKLQEAYAPACVKAIVEFALNGIHAPTPSPKMEINRIGGAGEGQASNEKMVQAPKQAGITLIGILVESHGHIDEHGGGNANIGLFTVRPFYE